MDNVSPPKSVNKTKSFQNLLALSAVTLIIVVWSMVTYQTHRKYLFVKTTVGGEQEYSLFDKNIEGSPKTHFEKQNSQKIPDFDLPEKLERNQLKDPKFIDGLF